MVKIAIFGVGLIGGSLALCFKGKQDYYVVGHSNNASSVEKYLKRGVVDAATTSLKEAAEGADFIFLCVPVSNLGDYLSEISQLKLKPGCIITDVGSTKGEITRYSRKIELGEAYFIGGHPMAGSERSGVEAASSLLYENAFYVLTPSENTPDEVYQRLAELLTATRAQIVRIDAEQHDEIVGAISHLPHIIAVALVNQIAGYNEHNNLHEHLAAGGFRDITRIASSEPGIWRDILISNRDVVLRLLKDWNYEVDNFIQLLEQSNGPGIEAEFGSARAFRNRLPERRKGILTSLYDIYIDVPDNPGVIGQITTLLGVHRINLSNIQIIESRADVPGILRLSFRNEADMEKAAAALKPHYSVHV